MKFQIIVLLHFHIFVLQCKSQLFGIRNQPWFRGVLSSLPISQSDIEFFPSPRDILSRPVVTIKDGSLRGFTLRTVNSREISAFQSIPYAQPPVGNLRFRDPVRNLPWSGIRNARARSPVCIQFDLSQQLEIVHGQEDCLYLNVYVPKQPASEQTSLPVIVWIHGGFFFLGSGSSYGPRYLLDHNVILVTVNFRLGPFGFLSTGDDASPGNQGLKDQVLALQWVRENIAAFGGSPHSITLAGQSAGAVSVGLHMLSPLSRGLFHRGVLQSSSALCFWGNLPKAAEIAKRVGEVRLCPIDSTHEMVECLRKVPANLLASMQLSLSEWLGFPLLRFAPTVEHDHPGAFMTKSPKEYYEDGEAANVSIIAGITTHELAFLMSIFIKSPLHVADINTEWEMVGPIVLNSDSTEFSSEKVNKMWSFYLGDDNKLTWATRLNASQFVSDRYVSLCTLEGMQYHSMYTNQSVYGYYLSYQGRYSTVQLAGSRPQDWGVVHNDDLIYLFNNPDIYPSLDTTDPEFEMSRWMTSMWSNFATYDKPFATTTNENITLDIWQPIKVTGSDSASVSLLNLSIVPHMINYTYAERYNFWKNEIYGDK